jgi:hypothetical protein
MFVAMNRQNLRGHPSVTRAVKAFWNVMPKTPNGTVTKSTFESLVERICTTVVPGHSGSQIMDAASAEFTARCGEAAEMESDVFSAALFEILDQAHMSTDGEELAAFARKLFHRTMVRVEGSGKPICGISGTSKTQVGLSLMLVEALRLAKEKMADRGNKHIAPVELDAVLREAAVTTELALPPTLGGSAFVCGTSDASDVTAEEAESVFARTSTDGAKDIIGDIALYDHLGRFVRRFLSCLDDADYAAADQFKDPFAEENQVSAGGEPLYKMAETKEIVPKGLTDEFF